MSVAVIVSGPDGEDAPELFGCYGSLSEAMEACPRYCGALLTDFETGKVYQSPLRYGKPEFFELLPGDNITALSVTSHS